MKRLSFCFLIIFFLLFSGCVCLPNNKKDTLQDIAYDVNKKFGYEIYLEEDSKYIPYLVLTSGYNDDSTLLLRKYLLPDTRPYKENESGFWGSGDNGAYYPESSIDEYLNNEFINMFSEKFREGIVMSDIEVTAKSSLGLGGEEKLNIDRKIFLLSRTEITGSENKYSNTQEGVELEYFKKDNAFIIRSTTFENGEKSAYWTRTPDTSESFTVFTIGKGAGVGAADIFSGVRPAFCLNGGTPVAERDDIVDGKTVFILKEEGLKN